MKGRAYCCLQAALVRRGLGRYAFAYTSVAGARGWIIWVDANTPQLLGSNWKNALGLIESGTLDFLATTSNSRSA
jgi:hypothetical protein